MSRYIEPGRAVWDEIAVYFGTARFHLEKGPGIQRLRACRKIPFSWNFVFFRIFSVYQWSVLRHEYRVE